jgi:hypothetical protein
VWAPLARHTPPARHHSVQRWWQAVRAAAHTRWPPLYPPFDTDRPPCLSAPLPTPPLAAPLTPSPPRVWPPPPLTLAAQIALAVSSNKLTLSLPSSFHPSLAQLVEKCCAPEPSARPNFPYIVKELSQAIAAIKKRVGGPGGFG